MKNLFLEWFGRIMFLIAWFISCDAIYAVVWLLWEIWNELSVINKK